MLRSPEPVFGILDRPGGSAGQGQTVASEKGTKRQGSPNQENPIGNKRMRKERKVFIYIHTRMYIIIS